MTMMHGTGLLDGQVESEKAIQQGRRRTNWALVRLNHSVGDTSAKT
jgi:hypothetical protein